ncbi:hypothetical protein GH714_035954 [Hevea brasiliensis]|uniref:MBD domain-containing protein n=1 Tax=Hevea brasiliensis TaxID=3981 RepID=A0A6A6L6I8_HEVBR|nr:hypothetical protein GH714_035954 [Hevea brasiliensis]
MERGSGEQSRKVYNKRGQGKMVKNKVKTSPHLYYYDPSGRRYNYKKEVLFALASRGLSNFQVQAHMLRGCSSYSSSNGGGGGEQSKNKKKSREDGDDQSENFIIFSHSGTYKESPETLVTLANIRIRRRPPYPRSYYTFRHYYSRGYGCLFPGCLAKERLMKHGRSISTIMIPEGIITIARMLLSLHENKQGWSFSICDQLEVKYT